MLVECPIPEASGLHPRWVEAACFQDAYRASLHDAGASVIDLYFAVFGHHPWWIKAALLARNRVARALGLATPPAAAILHPERRQSYRAGEPIGPWPIFSLDERELIAGRDNGHLDFRLSILREDRGAASTVVVSTACVVHNRFGRVYLWLVRPLHRWGVQRILARAIEAGRL